MITSLLQLPRASAALLHNGANTRLYRGSLNSASLSSTGVMRSGSITQPLEVRRPVHPPMTLYMYDCAFHPLWLCSSLFLEDRKRPEGQESKPIQRTMEL